MIPRLAGFLNIQGALGLAAAAFLAFLLGSSRIELRHAKKQSARFEQLYRAEVGAHAATVASVRAAADSARAADAANAARVRQAQDLISKRTASDFETRLADARARARQLRIPAAAAPAAGGGGSAPMPGLSAPSGGARQAPGQDRFPAAGLGPDEALIATEQALQLDALIDWVEAQALVRPADPAR